jgi:hypothetical protein
VYEGIAELDFGLEALRRHVRMLDAAQLTRSRSLVRGLQRAEVRARGPAAVAAWRDAVKSGRAGMVDRALLLSYFEDHIEELGAEDRALLVQLTPAVQPMDGAQLRAFARLFAKLGDTARASRLYQWVASSSMSSRFALDRGSGEARGLIPEMRRWLSGEEHIAAIKAILERSDPGGTPAERDEYVALLLDTWLDVAGPKAAGERCKEHLDAVLDTSRGAMRRAAIPAARIFAANGDAERAVKALETAVCGATPEAFPGLDFVPVRLSGRGMPGFIGPSDARKLFPQQRDPASDAWVERATGAVLEWHAAKRLSDDAARLLMGHLALRLHEMGNKARALEFVGRLDGLPGTSARHVVIDLARLLGDEEKARAIEDELLAKKSLNAERVPEVVERVRQTQGAEKALELGAAAAEWTPHPKLVEGLIAMATTQGRTEDVARFTKLREDNLTAAKALGTVW